ncbi:MAG: DUF3553 domain-containing protein [Planctomycetes bacterium]|nr:DUF3553 domain-containing protein [Planctomycetota bacterium]
MSTLKTGDFVRHVNCPEWGNGVIADLRGSMLVVLFENSDRPREFRAPCVFLKHAPDATAPKVAHLKSQLRASGSRRKSSAAPRVVRSFDEVVIGFRQTYPEGFASPSWVPIREEFAKASEMLKALTGRWKALVEEGKFVELGQAHREVVQKTGLMHPVQAVRISKITDGAFWFSYGQWILNEPSSEAHFDEVIKGLAVVSQATWPNLSALRGLAFPATDVFIKPDSVKRTAAALRQELPYDSKPTFSGYQRIVDFTKKVRDRLQKEGLAPADLWDVSQFYRLVAGRPLDTAKKPRETPAKPRKKAAAKIAADDTAKV